MRHYLVPMLLIVSIPLSLVASGFWLIFCLSVFMNDPDAQLTKAVDAIVNWTNWGYSTYTARLLIGAFGTAAGWAALLWLCVMPKRPWSQVWWIVKAGCVVGAVSMLIAPVTVVLALPPIVLSATLLWMAWKREGKVERLPTTG
jgi:hypothetical protein